MSSMCWQVDIESVKAVVPQLYSTQAALPKEASSISAAASEAFIFLHKLVHSTKVPITAKCPTAHSQRFFPEGGREEELPPPRKEEELPPPTACSLVTS